VAKKGKQVAAMGTLTYMAPEVLRESTERMKLQNRNQNNKESAAVVPLENPRSATQLYTDKVDIYALGIILFEMIHPMSTVHERQRVLRELTGSRIVP
jgi:serine/threonine protein kinase